MQGCKVSFYRETCSLWLECAISRAGITLSNGFTNSVPVTGGVIPKEVIIIICSLTLGTGSNAPLPCLAANKVS